MAAVAQTASAFADPDTPWSRGSGRGLSLVLVDLRLAWRRAGTPRRGRRSQPFATDLAQLLVALRGIDARNGPAAGPHNFHRAGSLSIYDAETRQSIGALAGEIDMTAGVEVWDTALEI